ncbi:hypothetical protein DSCO28_65200 [Desulfosarcina ovata subsp. sediminis]|uniref:Uncharacterized protein n=1 Tax=Desulfosarcina ovata subsp. sediminis TaxID=885957 RepID=A0A5K8A0P5_9BACT|nr:hypothetical protein DSCO28_65200 [Desulfosarcina ovata subsp. sediminis]
MVYFILGGFFVYLNTNVNLKNDCDIFVFFIFPIRPFSPPDSTLARVLVPTLSQHSLTYFYIL